MPEDVVTNGIADDPPKSPPLCDAVIVIEENTVGEAEGIDIRIGDDGNEKDASAVVAGFRLGSIARGK